MSLSRAKTQMLKHRDRLISQMALNELTRKELDKVDELTQNQIDAIESAIKTLDMGEAP